MDGWAYRIVGCELEKLESSFTPCKSVGDLILRARLERHFSPEHRMEVLAPEAADPEQVRALRARGCMVRRSASSRRVEAIHSSARSRG